MKLEVVVGGLLGILHPLFNPPDFVNDTVLQTWFSVGSLMFKNILPPAALLLIVRLLDAFISNVDVFNPFAIFKVSDRFNVEAFVTPNVDVPGTMSDGMVSVP